LNLKESLLNHLIEVGRDRDPYLATQGYFYVQQYLHSQLGQWGEVQTHNFKVRGKTHQNLILNLPGQNNTNPILIGAHYDAVPGTPGADDNASGVVALLEIAKAFSANPPKSPVRLIAFDMEEYGMVGSTAYAKQLKDAGQPLRLMLSLEMIGYCDKTPGSQKYPAGLQAIYPDTGDYIGLIGNLRTTPDLISLGRTIRQSGIPCQWLPVPNRGLPVPQTRLSDHSPFWDLGYPAIMVTDTSFMRNPHYHQPSDTIDTLDLDFLTGVCQGLIKGLSTL
jgi:Zn-dependent M28 family amino/carboxypeptidase